MPINDQEVISKDDEFKQYIRQRQIELHGPEVVGEQPAPAAPSMDEISATPPVEQPAPAAPSIVDINAPLPTGTVVPAAPIAPVEQPAPVAQQPAPAAPQQFTAEQIMQLIDNNAAMQQQLALTNQYAATLQQQLEASQTPQETPPVNLLQRFDLPQLDDRGAEFLKEFNDPITAAVRKVLNEELLPTVEPVLAQQQQSFSQYQAYTANANFENGMRAMYPDFQQESTTPEFNQFISTPLPYSNGVTVAHLLQEAYQHRDLNRYSEILSTYPKYATRGQAPVAQQPAPVAPVAQQPAPVQQKQPYHTPGGTGVPASIQPVKDKASILSEYSRQLEDFNAGRITREEHDVAYQKYIAALVAE